MIRFAGITADRTWLLMIQYSEVPHDTMIKYWRGPNPPANIHLHFSPKRLPDIDRGSIFAGGFGPRGEGDFQDSTRRGGR